MNPPSEATTQITKEKINQPIDMRNKVLAYRVLRMPETSSIQNLNQSSFEHLVVIRKILRSARTMTVSTVLYGTLHTGTHINDGPIKIGMNSSGLTVPDLGHEEANRHRHNQSIYGILYKIVAPLRYESDNMLYWCYRYGRSKIRR